MDKNTADYRAGITWDGNTDSCYIFLWDSTENGWKKRNVNKLYIDDYEIEVDWRELLENR